MAIILIKPADTDTVEQGFHDHNTNMDTLMAECIIADGTKALSADWDIGASRTIQIEKIQARSNLGLKLFEDGGLGLYIKDSSGYIAGPGVADPLQALHIKGNIELDCVSGVSPSVLLEPQITGISLSGFRVSPSTGTNAGSSLAIVGKGTGYASGVVMAQLMVFNTAIKEVDNIVFGGFRATSSAILFATGKAGTGVSKPIMLASRYLEDGATNANQLYLGVTGGVCVGGNNDPGLDNIYIDGNCSALTFTDRTESYNGDALKEISSIKSKNGIIDHDTLPEFAKSSLELRKPITRDTENIIDGKTMINQEIIGYETVVEQGRNVGAMVSILTSAINQLLLRIEELERKV